MELTILGHYGCFPAAGGACSGYLVQENGTCVLIDCGNGVLSRLQQFCRVQDLDAIVLSHLHFDHTADLLILKYALETLAALGEPVKRLPLLLPATPQDRAQLLGDESVFAVDVIRDEQRITLGALEFQFARMEHSIESYAVAIRAAGRQVTYSGDTVWTPRLAEFARGSDLFLCEAGLEDNGAAPHAGPHLTARQAAAVAQQACVRQLLLTHFWFQADQQLLLRQAQATFAATTLAEERRCYMI